MSRPRRRALRQSLRAQSRGWHGPQRSPETEISGQVWPRKGNDAKLPRRAWVGDGGLEVASGGREMSGRGGLHESARGAVSSCEVLPEPGLREKSRARPGPRTASISDFGLDTIVAENVLWPHSPSAVVNVWCPQSPSAVVEHAALSAGQIGLCAVLCAPFPCPCYCRLDRPGSCRHQERSNCKGGNGTPPRNPSYCCSWSLASSRLR